jgi:hypothetical protein
LLESYLARDNLSLTSEQQTKLIKEQFSPKDSQVGGDHYKTMAIQPGEYITKNNLGWYEGNVIKYVTRHKHKGKKQDLEKAIHYLQLAIEEYYP